MKFSSWALYILQAKAKYPVDHRMYDAILSLISDDNNAAENMAKLEKVPQAVVLSLEPIRKRITQSFLHQSTELAFLGDAINVVGVSGYEVESAMPLEFDSNKFFSFTDEIQTPSLTAFMSRFQSDVPSVDGIEISEADEDRVKVGRVCVLPPVLAEVAIANPFASPKELLLMFIKKMTLLKMNDWEVARIQLPEDKTFEDLEVNDFYTMRGKAPPGDEDKRILGHLSRHVQIDDDSSVENGDDGTSNEEKIMIGVLNVGYARAYLPILCTLWAYSQEEDVVGTMSVNRSPITDPENSEWYQEKKRTFILSKDTIPPPSSSNGNNDNISTEIRHLAQSITNDRNNRFASEGDEDLSSSSGKKKWNKLEETYRKTILFASTTDSRSPASEPSDRFISLLTAASAPVVSRLIRSWHNSTDIIVQAGMATSIGKGVLTSFPAAFEVNTFSPLFTPPSIAGFQDISNADETNLDLAMKSNQDLSDKQ